MTTFEERLAELRGRYAAARPKSRKLIDQAARYMPGGNTRSVLHFEPFPMVIAGGEGCWIRDVDDHDYIDCAGEFSAGLYGHGDPAIKAAQHRALDDGLALVGPNLYEAGLAQEICRRFPSVAKLRFCNSGTEANLFAVITARQATGRRKVLVFDGAYHGGVMTFSGGGSPMNVPFQFVVAPYNDEEAAAEAIREHASDLAAVLVEPVLGAAGNIAGAQSFMRRLRSETNATGSLLIFDEVKTSRLGRGGVQALVGVTPDLTTFGKYLGAGLPFGAFGGRDDIMGLYDPYRPDALKHAGTFNNNVMSMAGGLTGLREVFTAERADAFLEIGDRFREQLAARFETSGIPVRPSGRGSMISLHVGSLPRTAADVNTASAALRSLIHLRGLEEGLATTPRGDIFLSLPMSQAILKQMADLLVRIAGEEVSFVVDDGG